MIFPPISLLSHHKRTPVPSHMRQYNVLPSAITMAPSISSPPNESGVIGKEKLTPICMCIPQMTSCPRLPKMFVSCWQHQACIRSPCKQFFLPRSVLHCLAWPLKGLSCVPRVRRAVASISKVSYLNVVGVNYTTFWLSM